MKGHKMTEKHGWTELFKNTPTWKDIIDDREIKLKDYKALFVGGELDGQTIALKQIDEMGYINAWNNDTDYKKSFPIVGGYKEPIIKSDNLIVYREELTQLQEVEQKDRVSIIQDENGHNQKVLLKFIK